MDPVFWFLLIALSALFVGCALVYRRRSSNTSGHLHVSDVRRDNAQAEHAAHMDNIRNSGPPN